MTKRFTPEQLEAIASHADRHPSISSTTNLHGPWMSIAAMLRQEARDARTMTNRDAAIRQALFAALPFNDEELDALVLVVRQLVDAKGFVRPVRTSYRHNVCGSVTTMGRVLAETYARDPAFYGATFCVRCNRHLPVAEFVWTEDGTVLGS
jgi:hypothetical protein